LIKLAIPLMISSLSEYSGKVLTTVFAGHFLTTDEFDAVALGNTMTNITGYSIIFAFASPMDSICTQAYGAGNWKLFSVTVHRAIICTVIFLIPTILLWLNMDKVLIICGQDPVIATFVYQWTLIYLAMLPAYAISTIIVRFLSSQGITKPLFYIGIAVYGIWHPLLLSLVMLKMGKTDFVWFPLCNVITGFFYITVLMGYMMLKRPHHEKSFQRVSFADIFRWRSKRKGSYICAPKGIGGRCNNKQIVDKGLSEYVMLLFAGMFSMCGEWWSWEVITILTGLLGPDPLAVHVIYAMIIPLIYKLPSSLGMAGAARIGALVGQNRYEMARRVGSVILWIVLFESLLVASLSYFLRGYIPMIFSSDPKVIECAVKLSPLFCAFVIPHGMQGIFQGLLRGIKRQGRSVYAVVIGAWFISIPCAALLAFYPLELKIYGVWAGNNIGYYVMDTIFLYLWISYEWKQSKRRPVGLLEDDHNGVNIDRLELDVTCVAGSSTLS